MDKTMMMLTLVVVVIAQFSEWANVVDEVCGV